MRNKNKCCSLSKEILGSFKHVFWDCCNKKHKNIVKKTPESNSPVSFLDRVTENVDRKIELSNMAKEDKQDKPNTLDKSDKDFVVINIDGSSPVAVL